MFLSSCRQEGPAVLDPALLPNAGNLSDRVAVSQRLGVSYHLAMLCDVSTEAFAIHWLLCPRL